MSSPAWLTLAQFKARSVMPAEDVDRLETQYAGFVAQQLASYQAWIEGRLRKRYAIPFDAASPPETARAWLTALVTVAAYQRRGWNPASAENELIIQAAATAREEIKEAADSDVGLFDLPRREDAAEGSGVERGGPFGYSEASPYVWTTGQAEAGRSEDG